jgi:hypothetical protein
MIKKTRRKREKEKNNKDGHNNAMELYKFMNSTNDWEFELCNSVNVKILERYGENAEADKFPELERVIVMVWAATGIIENGGFEYYFSSILPGDYGYKYTIDSFITIGSLKAMSAIDRAFRLFHNGMPPDNKQKRMAIYNQYPEEIKRSINIEFYNSIEEIEKCLAAYIIKNQLHKKWEATPIM